MFTPYRPVDYRGLIDEYLAARAKKEKKPTTFEKSDYKELDASALACWKARREEELE